jgi:hypothetical protein
MRHSILAVLISIIAASLQANNLGISIHMGQPGFYGQINLGDNYPRPQLIYPDPILAMPPTIAIQQQPIYLYVPPGHAKKWNKHCHRYNACNQPVYFIQKEWYDNTYVPHLHSHGDYSDKHNNINRHRYQHDNNRDKHSKRDEARRGIEYDNQKHKHGREGRDKRGRDQDNQND